MLIAEKLCRQQTQAGMILNVDLKDLLEEKEEER